MKSARDLVRAIAWAVILVCLAILTRGAYAGPVLTSSIYGTNSHVPITRGIGAYAPVLVISVPVDIVSGDIVSCQSQAELSFTESFPVAIAHYLWLSQYQDGSGGVLYVTQPAGFDVQIQNYHHALISPSSSFQSTVAGHYFVSLMVYMASTEASGRTSAAVNNLQLTCVVYH